MVEKARQSKLTLIPTNEPRLHFNSPQLRANPR